MELTQHQIESFDEDGFVVLERVLDAETVEAARERFPKLFSGDSGTGARAGIRPN